MTDRVINTGVLRVWALLKELRYRSLVCPRFTVADAETWSPSHSAGPSRGERGHPHHIWRAGKCSEYRYMHTRNEQNTPGPSIICVRSFVHVSHLSAVVYITSLVVVLDAAVGSLGSIVDLSLLSAISTACHFVHCVVQHAK